MCSVFPLLTACLDRPATTLLLTPHPEWGPVRGGDFKPLPSATRCARQVGCGTARNRPRPGSSSMCSWHLTPWSRMPRLVTSEPPNLTPFETTVRAAPAQPCAAQAA